MSISRRLSRWCRRRRCRRGKCMGRTPARQSGGRRPRSSSFADHHPCPGHDDHGRSGRGGCFVLGSPARHRASPGRVGDGRWQRCPQHACSRRWPLPRRQARNRIVGWPTRHAHRSGVWAASGPRWPDAILGGGHDERHAGVAMPQQSRSHFTAKDAWWSGVGGAPSQPVGSGVGLISASTPNATVSTIRCEPSRSVAEVRHCRRADDGHRHSHPAAFTLARVPAWTKVALWRPSSRRRPP